MHHLQLGLHRHDRRALGLDQLLGGSVRGPKVCNRLAVQCHCVVVIDRGHPVAMRACGDCRLVLDKRDPVRPTRLQRVERLGNAGGGSCSSNPTLVLLRVQTTLFDDTDPDVNDVVINNQVPCGVGVSRACEEAGCKGIKTVAGMPVGSHPLAIRIAIFRRHRTVVLREPLEHGDEDNVWFAKAPLLEGGVYPDQNGVEEDIGEGSIHGDDVSPCFLVKGMSCTNCSAAIFVSTISIVRYFIQ